LYIFNRSEIGHRLYIGLGACKIGKSPTVFEKIVKN